jgi:hypothetical protein
MFPATELRMSQGEEIFSNGSGKVKPSLTLLRRVKVSMMRSCLKNQFRNG